MSCGCGCGAASGCGNEPCPPVRELEYCVQTPQTLAHSLGRALIFPVDKIRDLNTRLGLRPYIVRWIYTRYSGGARGIGEESVIVDERVLPTPLILDLSGVAEIVTAAGADEQGGVMLTEFSGCYTEEKIRGLGDGGESIPADQAFYYEIEFLRADGVRGERRRFVISGVPEYSADDYTWRIKLARSRPDRQRNGATR